MGFLDRDHAPPVQVQATIERVAVTAWDNGGKNSSGTAQEVWLTFSFQDPDGGGLVTQQHKYWIGFGSVPLPGSAVTVSYPAENPGKIDYDADSVKPPDASIPRGWGAGIFEVEDLGGHHAHAVLGEGKIADHRELFRTGQPQPAVVVGRTCGSWRRRGVYEYTFTLQVGERQLQAKAWVAPDCAPQEGDLIKVAIGPDGDVALDSDERYSGPPGQALVFTTPPDVAARRATQPQGEVNNEMLAATQEMLSAFGVNVQIDGLSQTSVTAVPAPAPPSAHAPEAAAPAVPSAEDQKLEHLRQLADLHDRGALTDDEFARAKAKLLDA